MLKNKIKKIKLKLIKTKQFKIIVFFKKYKNPLLDFFVVSKPKTKKNYYF